MNVNIDNNTTSGVDRNSLVNHKGHGVEIKEDGPEGQLVYEQRFQVAFKESSSICRKVYFTHFIAWMGKIRELPMHKIAEGLVHDFTSGEWGMVTNSTSLKVFGDVTAYDIVQARAWIGNIHGSSFSTYIEFSKVNDDDSIELLGLGEVKATWVRLVEYGVPSPRVFPQYVEDYLKVFAPNGAPKFDESSLSSKLSTLDLGKELYRKPPGIGIGTELRREQFQTTLEEANLVGNVYYANYFIWQGRVRDLFVYSLAPELVRSPKSDTELVCLYTRMDYLREAMPYDQVVARMAAESVSECGATLKFEFYRKESNGKLTKLSIGMQNVAWVDRSDGEAKAAPWPEKLLQGLLSTKDDKSVVNI